MSQVNITSLRKDHSGPTVRCCAGTAIRSPEGALQGEGVPKGTAGMGSAGERVGLREPPGKAGRSGLKAILRPLQETVLSAKQC